MCEQTDSAKFFEKKLMVYNNLTTEKFRINKRRARGDEIRMCEQTDSAKFFEKKLIAYNNLTTEKFRIK